jgi:hypothetical protein
MDVKLHLLSVLAFDQGKRLVSHSGIPQGGKTSTVYLPTIKTN